MNLESCCARNAANRQIRTATFRANPARQLVKGTEPDKSLWDETSDSDGGDELKMWRWQRGLGERYKSFSESLPGRTGGGGLLWIFRRKLFMSFEPGPSDCGFLLARNACLDTDCEVNCSCNELGSDVQVNSATRYN